jgi:ubiquitin carboxyl-terminal hydrolase 15
VLVLSVIQCLSNSPLITDYFLRGEHVFDINTVSKMGTGGQLAVDYGELMQEMWSTDASLSAVQPKRLKAAIGKFKPQFENNEQQDAQELLTVLLEGLGEDLNRVKKKPYIQNADSNGRPDPVVAEEWWVSHLARERSIVTLFQVPCLWMLWDVVVFRVVTRLWVRASAAGPVQISNSLFELRQ